MSDDDPWARAWASARQKRADDAPRTAAGRAAFEATKPFKGKPVEEVRAVLVRELAARGVEDLTSEQLDVLVECVVTSPFRASVRLGFQGLKRVGQLLGEARRLASPRWTVPPADIPSVSSWRDDQLVVSVALLCDPSAHDVVARLFADLPHHARRSGESDDSLRMSDCWFSADLGNGVTSVINVHIGKFTIAQLHGENAEIVRALIAECGGQRHAVGSFAEVHGDDPDTGSIKIFFPDRP